MGLKILFTPSDNNLAGAFQSMVRLCILLRDKYGCDVLVLLRRNGRGEELLKENEIENKCTIDCYTIDDENIQKRGYRNTNIKIIYNY